MSKIIGNTVGMGLPKPNLMQTDPTKGDYVWGKEEFLAQAGQNLNLTVEIITVGEDSGESVAVTGLSLDLTSYNAKVGSGFYINPIVAPTNATNRSVSWKSSKPAVATVNDMGYVECIAEGDAVITCTTVDGGYTATCAVSVAAAESGGGDSGEDTGGGAAGQKIQFSTLEKTNGVMKGDGTVADTIGGAYCVTLPYSDGMFISTATNKNWNQTNYPPVLVLDNGGYTAPAMTPGRDDLGNIGGKYAAQFTCTLSGFSAAAVVYVTLLSGTAGATEMDNADVWYYIPGGES